MKTKQSVNFTCLSLIAIQAPIVRLFIEKLLCVSMMKMVKATSSVDMAGSIGVLR
jgi:hypothetical protein